MLRRGGSVSEIASFVCRSEREVRDKAKELGLRSASPPSRRVCAASPRSRFQSDRDRTRRRRAARWEQRQARCPQGGPLASDARTTGISATSSLASVVTIANLLVHAPERRFAAEPNRRDQDDARDDHRVVHPIDGRIRGRGRCTSIPCSAAALILRVRLSNHRRPVFTLVVLLPRLRRRHHRDRPAEVRRRLRAMESDLWCNDQVILIS